MVLFRLKIGILEEKVKDNVGKQEQIKQAEEMETVSFPFRKLCTLHDRM